MTTNKQTNYKTGKVTSTTLRLNGDWSIVSFDEDGTVVLKRQEDTVFGNV